MTEPHFPEALHGLAVASLVLAGICAVVIAADELRRPQKMAVMNLVWPLCALFGSVLWLGAYFAWGRGPRPREGEGGHRALPMAVKVGKGASHCGAGCTLGDIVGEGLALLVPGILLAFGWGSLFGDKIFATWLLDFLFAFLFGIAFQYYTIKPMRGLSVGQGILAALRADILSISAWQVGMFGIMGLVQFGWARPRFGAPAPATSPEFWLIMQGAMLAGFAVAYPVNAWLIRIGWKEAM